MNVPLTLAIHPYDHARDLRPQGIDLTVLELPIEEIFFRFTKFREWDASEMSFGKTVSLMSQPSPDIVPIPVFPSRVFRHSAIYIGEKSSIKQPKDLAGVRQPGRIEKVELRLPAGVRITPVPDKSLAQMLAAGELDAVISARDPGGRRLFENYQDLEQAYFRKTHIYPIMHVIVLRRDAYERDRWIAMNLFKAFEEAKRQSMQRLMEIGLSHVPMPWLAEHAQHWREAAGDDFWPYGIEPNRRTLEPFLQYAFEQGIAQRHLKPEELFAPETRESFKI
jgi:4,5-dihydroxyphthalate decarboxylase